MGTIATARRHWDLLQGLRRWPAGRVQPRLALTADAWDDQLFLVASYGYRGIAQDRSGGGRSGQPWNGNDLDTYADDLAALKSAKIEGRDP